MSDTLQFVARRRDGLLPYQRFRIVMTFTQGVALGYHILRFGAEHHEFPHSLGSGVVLTSFRCSFSVILSVASGISDF